MTLLRSGKIIHSCSSMETTRGSTTSSQNPGVSWVKTHGVLEEVDLDIRDVSVVVVTTEEIGSKNPDAGAATDPGKVWPSCQSRNERSYGRPSTTVLHCLEEIAKVSPLGVHLFTASEGSFGTKARARSACSRMDQSDLVVFSFGASVVDSVSPVEFVEFGKRAITGQDLVVCCYEGVPHAEYIKVVCEESRSSIMVARDADRLVDAVRQKVAGVMRNRWREIEKMKRIKESYC